MFLNKKGYFIFLLSIFLLFVSIDGFSYQGYFKIRALGSLGYTGGNKVYVGDGSLLNYRFHMQGFYNITRNISLGLDLFYLHAFTAKYTKPVLNDAWSSYNKVSYISTSIVSNFEFVNELLLLQAGVGPYIGFGNENDSVDPGFMIGFGIDIPILYNLSLPIITRFDFIFSERFLVAMNVMVGITYRFRFKD